MVLVYGGVDVPLHGQVLQHLVHHVCPKILPVDGLQLLPADPHLPHAGLDRPEDQDSCWLGRLCECLTDPAVCLLATPALYQLSTISCHASMMASLYRDRHQ